MPTKTEIKRALRLANWARNSARIATLGVIFARAWSDGTVSVYSQPEWSAFR